ncbi:MAG: OmpH family outer membrane protein [Tannerellaceae bacterium]|jgi:outer membrane protein|nr:OmpH family outer membrane protein [Tannerellaceae bacterium]
MKNINYITNGALAIAVVILFVLHFTDRRPGAPDSSADTAGEVMTDMPVAYINMDSLLQNYNYAKDLNEVILSREEHVRANLNQQTAALESEAIDFRRKLDNNAFLTRERAEQEQQRLMKKEQELKISENRQTQELLAEHQRLTEQLRDTLISQLRVFNRAKGFRIIFSNTAKDNIILADDVYDITNELVVYLNNKYAPAPMQK